jgi:hypothetical protein
VEISWSRFFGQLALGCGGFLLPFAAFVLIMVVKKVTPTFNVVALGMGSVAFVWMLVLLPTDERFARNGWLFVVASAFALGYGFLAVPLSFHYGWLAIRKLWDRLRRHWGKR